MRRTTQTSLSTQIRSMDRRDKPRPKWCKAKPSLVRSLPAKTASGTLKTILPTRIIPTGYLEPASSPCWKLQESLCSKTAQYRSHYHLCPKSRSGNEANKILHHQQCKDRTQRANLRPSKPLRLRDRQEHKDRLLRVHRGRRQGRRQLQDSAFRLHPNRCSHRRQRVYCPKRHVHQRQTSASTGTVDEAQHEGQTVRVYRGRKHNQSRSADRKECADRIRISRYKEHSRQRYRNWNPRESGRLQTSPLADKRP